MECLFADGESLPTPISPTVERLLNQLVPSLTGTEGKELAADRPGGDQMEPKRLPSLEVQDLIISEL